MPRAENFFQAQKFAGPEYEEARRPEPSPMVVARMGRDRKKPLRADWEAVKDEIMRKAVLAKFTQHADLRAQLLDTGEARIVDHTANDSYWGEGGDGTGKNMPGVILMEIRENHRRNAEPFSWLST